MILGQLVTCPCSPISSRDHAWSGDGEPFVGLSSLHCHQHRLQQQLTAAALTVTHRKKLSSANVCGQGVMYVVCGHDVWCDNWY